MGDVPTEEQAKKTHEAFLELYQQSETLLMDTHIARLSAHKDGSISSWRTMKELEVKQEEVSKEAAEKSSKMTVELCELEDRIAVEVKSTPGSHREAQLKELEENEKAESIHKAVLQTKVEAIETLDTQLAQVRTKQNETKNEATETKKKFEVAEEYNRGDHVNQKEGWDAETARLNAEREDMEDEYTREIADIDAQIAHSEQDGDARQAALEREMSGSHRILRGIQDQIDEQARLQDVATRAVEDKVRAMSKTLDNKYADHKAKTAGIRKNVLLQEKKNMSKSNAVNAHVDMLASSLKARGIDTQAIHKGKIIELKEKLDTGNAKLQAIENDYTKANAEAQEVIVVSHNNQNDRQHQAEAFQNKIRALELDFEMERQKSVAHQQSIRVKNTLLGDSQSPSGPPPHHYLPRSSLLPAAGLNRLVFNAEQVK